MSSQIIDLFAIQQQYIQYAITNRTSYTAVVEVEFEGQTLECVVLCYQGNLSLMVGEDIKSNTWTVDNWRSRNKKIWSIFGQLLIDSEHLLSAMNVNNVPYNFVFREKNIRQTVVFIRRHGKNYVFLNTDVYISEGFVHWIQERKISLPIGYNNQYYICK